MKDIARVWWGVCLTLLCAANAMLFIYMMLMMGFWSQQTIYPIFYLFMWSVMLSYYCAAPLACFGFLCALGCSMAKQTGRAALLAALSGGALFSAIVVWANWYLGRR